MRDLYENELSFVYGAGSGSGCSPRSPSKSSKCKSTKGKSTKKFKCTKKSKSTRRYW